MGLLQKTFLFDLVLQSGARGLAMLEEKENDEEKSAEGALKRTMDVLLGEGTTESEDDVENDDDVQHDDQGSNANEQTSLASDDVANVGGKPRKRRKSS